MVPSAQGPGRGEEREGIGGAGKTSGRRQQRRRRATAGEGASFRRPRQGRARGAGARCPVGLIGDLPTPATQCHSPTRPRQDALAAPPRTAVLVVHGGAQPHEGHHLDGHGSGAGNAASQCPFPGVSQHLRQRGGFLGLVRHSRYQVAQRGPSLALMAQGTPQARLPQAAGRQRGDRTSQKGRVAQCKAMDALSPGHAAGGGVQGRRGGHAHHHDGCRSPSSSSQHGARRGVQITRWNAVHSLGVSGL